MKIIKIIIITLFINSCCQEGIETEKYLLTNETKKIIPYSGNETIKMKYSSGFDFILNVTERRTELLQTETEHCGNNYITYEELNVTLNSQIPELDINIKVSPKGFDSFVDLSINRYNFGFDYLSEPDFDTLKVNEINYKNVYLLENNFIDNDIITPERVLYNNEFGIIQITMTNDDKINLQL